MNRLINFLLIGLLNFNANVESEIECGLSLHENVSPVKRWMLNSTISLPKFNPWNVLISGKDKTCGGVLVQIYPNTKCSEIVLTSSQCFIDKEGHRINHADYKVYLGGHSFNENKKTTTISVGIKQITVMEFDKQTMQNDLAMLILETTVPFDYNIRGICLPHYTFDIKHADWISLTGWKTHTSRKNYGLRSSGILQNIPIITLSEEECEEIIPIFHKNYHTCGIHSTKYFYKHRTAVDIGSPLLFQASSRRFVYGLYSGRHFSNNKTEDVLLFHKIGNSVLWLIRSYTPDIKYSEISIIDPMMYET
ncbi:Granzyme [Trichinella spiralis]|uniref:Granzyme n=1 Tax=Trichinella spiralis TaxID=6334 RepID=A0ABR3KVP4_TRISP